MNKWQVYYPRPHLKRDSFFSLDGIWKIDNDDIIVPFVRESKLSEYKGNVEKASFTYQKSFSLPKNFKPYGHSVLLHFGAVDQIAEIILNGQSILKHYGGYLPFTIDITEYLNKDNLLEVKCNDATDILYPYGKQSLKPHGMWYTAVSGIWKSVWLEAVPKNYIRDIKINTDLSKVYIDIDSDAMSYIVDVDLGQKDHFKQYYESKHIEIELSNFKKDIRYWTVDDPYLYKITINTNNDSIESYFGIRTIENKNGTLYLNNKPILLKGVLDQGYFDDGIFTPNDPLEYFNDVLRMKELGFNTIRKHIKIEPDVFYYACDKLGMLVIQDAVNNGPYSFIKESLLPTIGINIHFDKLFADKKRIEIFKNHTKEMISHLYNHPSIIAYTIFNEGWGQKQTDEIYLELKKQDNSRLYDSSSGWFKTSLSDFDSHHIYFKNKILRSNNSKPLLLSECGGFSRNMNSTSSNKEYGYGKCHSEEELSDKYKEMFMKMIYPSIKNGLCGYIITQLSDIENEINGFYTYDRKVCKVNKKKLLDLNNQADSYFNKRF